MGQRAADLSLSARLSGFSIFCHFTPSVFSPSLFLALFVVLYIFHSLSSASVFLRFSYLRPPTASESFSFFVCPHLALSFTCYGVKRLTDSGLTVSEMMGFAGGALLSIYLQWKVRHMPTQQDLRDACISKEPLGFELVSEQSSVFKSWGCSQVKITFDFSAFKVKVVFFSHSFV